MAVTIEEVVEAAASGVLRAMDARKGNRDTADVAVRTTENLVQSGFTCAIHIVCGGFPGIDPYSGGSTAPVRPTNAV
jgi:hypothetical protein